MLTRFLCFLVGAQSVAAFVPQNPQSVAPMAFSPTTTTALSAIQMSYDDLVTRVDHYEVAIPKPLGVVFGENPDPFFGLVVDDVAEGLNGGIAGLRVGDQLMAVNENVVVGKDFDDVMGLLQNEPTTLRLIMYRGPVSQLFTVISNQLQEGEAMYDDEEEEEEEEVIMDENYESPVRIEVKEEKPLTAGDVFKAVGKLGSMFAETMTADPNEGKDPSSPPPPKKNTGFFGIGGETVQLDARSSRLLRAFARHSAGALGAMLGPCSGPCSGLGSTLSGAR